MHNKVPSAGERCWVDVYGIIKVSFYSIYYYVTKVPELFFPPIIGTIPPEGF